MDESTRNIIIAAIKEKTFIKGDKEKLPCAEAFAIENIYGVGCREIGKICNDIGITISGCQLGCF